MQLVVFEEESRLTNKGLLKQIEKVKQQSRTHFKKLSVQRSNPGDNLAAPLNITG